MTVIYIFICCFASLLCLIPGYFADHLMAGPWQYHLFNLPPAPPPPNAVQLLFPSYSTCGLFIPCRLLERTQWGSTDLRVHDNTRAIWSVCYSALLWRLEAKKIKASAAGNSWDANTTTASLWKRSALHIWRRQFAAAAFGRSFRCSMCFGLWNGSVALSN